MKWLFPGDSVVKNPPAMQETWVLPLCWADPLEKRMTTHSSILAWILQSMLQSTVLHAGYSPWGHKESDTAERLSFSLSKEVRLVNVSQGYSWKAEWKYNMFLRRQGLHEDENDNMWRWQKEPRRMSTQPLYLCHGGSHVSRNNIRGTSLVVQWLRLLGGTGLILGWGTKIPHPTQWGQKKKRIT